MHLDSIQEWEHDHTFGQDRVRAGERRTLIVVAVTLITMVVEIAAGIAYGSMALLADGLHMGSHALALGITAFAYVYARRHARDERFSFGTGKVNSLAGFAGAVLLGVFAIMMAWESVERILNPVEISFNQAIFVAVIGLIVNAVSVFVLGGHHDNHDHEHHGESGHGDCHHHDHNLRSAYLHVLADALTSVLAIAALVSGKFLGWTWLDPVMGLVGAALITHWSAGLLRTTAHVLLDRQGPSRLETAIRDGIDGPEQKITDLHTWAIGPGKYAAIVSVVACEPRTADHYKNLVPNGSGLVHLSVEVHHCPRDHS